MHVIRLGVLENRLSDPSVVTEADYHAFMARDTKSWVCEVLGAMVGFVMVDAEKQNVWALFAAPEHKRRGIGRALHEVMLAWSFKRAQVIRLSTAPNTRAEMFYRKAAYAEVGLIKHAALIFKPRLALRRKLHDTMVAC